MLSEQSQRIKEWMYQNIKNAPAPASVLEARARIEVFGSRAPLPEEARVDLIKNSTVSGEKVCFGKVSEDKAILYFHGGGYIMGSSKSSRGLALDLSKASNCPVYSIDYRLAPEHPFPAALEDACTAYRWIETQDYLPEQIIVVGESAGGGLALASLLSLRDAGKELPAGLVLICPWTDLTGTVSSRVTKADCDPWYNPESIENKAADLYTGNNDKKNPLISPLYADLHNMPPILIHAATDDTLFDDSVQLLARGKAAGIDMNLEIWDGMWHVFHNFAAVLPEGAEAFENIGAFVKNKLGII